MAHPTIHEVAQAAGVSISTVSRALNGTGRIAGATRRRVLQIATDLGYQPNDLARSLVAKSTQTVAVIVPEITNPFFPELVHGIGQAAGQRGHLVLLCDSGGDETRLWRDLAALRRKQVDGLILAGARLDGPRLTAVTAGLPVVCVDRDVRLAAASLVRSDHRAGAAQAIRHLLDLGHRRIATLTGPADLEVARARCDGAAEALAEAGIPERELLEVPSGFLEQDGYAAMRQLIGQGADFTAVFAANDLCAIGAMAALEEHGIDVPTEVSVVGFDDIHLASYTRPRLTTIRQDVSLMGRRAAEILIDGLLARDRKLDPAEPVREELPVTLVVRESTAPCARARTSSGPPGGRP